MADGEKEDGILHQGENGKTVSLLEFPPGVSKTGPNFNLLDRSVKEPERREIHLLTARTLGILRNETMLLDQASTFYKDRPNMTLGDKIGQGGFSSVYAVKDDPEVVCKFLSDSLFEISCEEDLQMLKVGAVDIVREAWFLYSLHHENIISLKGVGSMDDIGSYYLCLDKLSACFAKKLEEWPLATAENELLRERLLHAMSIVSVFSYLHSKQVVYRDLKLENLGLRYDGNLVLYDFGLAKGLNGPGDSNGKYKLTGNTGSSRYMAPEVAKLYKYNLSVDVYSFGIVLWELCSGKFAFPDQPKGGVNGDRPPLVRTWPIPLEDLMKDCWHWNSSQRPTFPQVNERLEAIMQEHTPEHHGGLLKFLHLKD